jgi:hypothetical protein
VCCVSGIALHVTPSFFLLGCVMLLCEASLDSHIHSVLYTGWIVEWFKFCDGGRCEPRAGSNRSINGNHAYAWRCTACVWSSISLGRSADVIRGEHAQPCAHENPGHLPLKLHLATCFVDPLSPSLTYLRSTILVLFASIATS